MIRIDWALGYANSPRIIIEENLELRGREECEFTEAGTGIWEHEQENGIVQYFAHSGSDENEGGFGGAVFTVLRDGEPRRFAGPWSSRATYLNRFRDRPVVDIELRNGGYHRRCAITLEALKERWDAPFYLIEAEAREDGEPSPITPSVRPDRIEKPDGQIVQEGAFIVHAEPA